MSTVTIPVRSRKPSLNQAYGLAYRSIPVKVEDYKKLSELKQRTGQPYTALLSMAIEHFLKSVKSDT